MIGARIDESVWDYTDFCIQCEYDTVNPADEVIHTSVITDFWSFQLTTHPCSSALQERNPDFFIEFNINDTAVLINPNGYTDFFDHADPATCPYEGCELKYPSSWGSSICDNVPDPDYAQLTLGMNVTIFPKESIAIDLCYICQAGSIKFTTKFAVYSEIILGTLTPAFANQTIMADPSDTSPY